MTFNIVMNVLMTVVFVVVIFLMTDIESTATARIATTVLTLQVI